MRLRATCLMKVDSPKLQLMRLVDIPLRGMKSRSIRMFQESIRMRMLPCQMYLAQIMISYPESIPVVKTNPWPWSTTPSPTTTPQLQLVSKLPTVPSKAPTCRDPSSHLSSRIKQYLVISDHLLLFRNSLRLCFLPNLTSLLSFISRTWSNKKKPTKD